MKHSCENIYAKLRKWKKVPASKHKTNEEKLTYIIGTIRDLQNAIDLSLELKMKSEVSFLTDSSNLTPRRII